MAVPIFRYCQNSLIKTTPRMTAHLRGFHGLLGFLSIRRALQEVGLTKIFKCTPGVSVAEILGLRQQQTDHSHITWPGNVIFQWHQGNILHLLADTTLKSWLSQQPMAEIEREHGSSITMIFKINQKNIHTTGRAFPCNQKVIQSLQNIEPSCDNPGFRGTTTPWNMLSDSSISL